MSELLSEGEEERKYKKQAREIMEKSFSALPADQAQLFEKQGEETEIDALLRRYLEELGNRNLLREREYFKVTDDELDNAQLRTINGLTMAGRDAHLE